MITDLRKKDITLILIVIDIIGALAMAMIASIPGLDYEIVVILISTAVLSLTLALLGSVIYIRHYTGPELEPAQIKLNPPV